MLHFAILKAFNLVARHMPSNHAPKRPVFFEPLKTSLPLPALISITHRLSGLALIFFVPLALMTLSYSLLSEQNFLFVQHRLHVCPFAKAFAIITLTAWIFHALAGVRHLLMDIHLFDNLPAARFSAAITFIIATLVSLLITGAILWV